MVKVLVVNGLIITEKEDVHTEFWRLFNSNYDLEFNEGYENSIMQFLHQPLQLGMDDLKIRFLNR